VHVIDSPAPPYAPVVASRTLAVDLLRLVRPLHWAKNVIVVPVALLDAPAWSPSALGRVALAVLAFTLAAALAYVGNDITDRHRDRLHQHKRHRPIAAGRIPLPVARGFGALLATGLALLIVLGGPARYWPVLASLALHLAYTRSIKHVPLVEAGAVAAGFVLRVVQGYVATGGSADGWLLVAVFSLCLLLILGKRRNELLTVGAEHRPALRGYSVQLADHLLLVTGMLATVTGLLYLRTAVPFGPYGQPVLLVSTPLALFAYSRYLQAVLIGGAGDDPVRFLLRDRALVVVALLWVGSLGVAVLLARYRMLAGLHLP
jgi:decaprenyl-phosphate phosphoribosyltransferase